MSVSQLIIENYRNSPLLIRLAWDFIGVVSVLILITLTYLKLYRQKLRIAELIGARYEAQYEQDLITYIFAESDEEINSEQTEIIEKFSTIVKHPFRRKIVIRTLLKLKNEISGETAEAIDRFYLQTGLVKYTFENLRSKEWYLNAKGVRELKQFNVKKVHNVVLANINHPRIEVRKEMQLYLVNLFQYKGLEFLDTLETHLSEWDQIQLLEVLESINTHDTFEIKPWLKSDNDSVIIFSLHLAKIYNLFEVKDELLELLDHSNQKIKVQAILLLNHFFILDAKDVLKTSFAQRSQDEQIAIFRFLENTYDVDDEDFVLQHINHPNFETKVCARRILRDINLVKFKLSQSVTTNPINPLIDCNA